jgi:hypothetical protein
MDKLLVTIPGYYSALLILREEEEPIDVKPSDTIQPNVDFELIVELLLFSNLKRGSSAPRFPSISKVLESRC